MFGSVLRRSFAARPSHASRQLIASRPISVSSRQLARRDAQGKDDLKPEPNEYSKSGSDDAAAAVEDAAFSPDKTRPEEQHASAEKEADGQGKMDNPLEVSPANKEVSEWSSPQSGGHENAPEPGKDGSDRARTSGGGSPSKAGGGKSGGGS